MNTSNCRRLALVFGFALTTCSCASRPQVRQRIPPLNQAVVAANPGVKRLAAGTNTFGFQLLHQLTAKQPGENVFFSPFSISQALLLTLNGAGGSTQQGTARTLGLTDLPQSQINHANALLLPSITNPDPKVEVSVANALWASRGVVFAPAYQQQCRRFYNAQATTLDFSSPGAADTINNWVSHNTKSKIAQIVSPNDLSASVAVLTNAVYFHGSWQSQFDKNETANGPFFLAHGTKTVPLMSQTKTFPYLNMPKFQAVSLPYGAGRMSMVIFLPKPGTSLSTVVSGLNTGSVDRVIGAMKPTDLLINLPRFKANYEANLTAPLSALGMGSAFSPGADFAPMGLRGAHISAVLHKAVLEVDEEGTVAAASTAVEMACGVFVPGTVVRVDHPFFCAIRDKVTGDILFEGVIQNPQG